MNDDPRGLGPVEPSPSPPTAPGAATASAAIEAPSAPFGEGPPAVHLVRLDAPPLVGFVEIAAPNAAPSLVVAAPAARPYQPDYRFLTVLTVVSLVADLATKAWAKGRLAGFEPRPGLPRKVEVWKDHLDFVYALNPGGAWSFLRGLPELFRRPFFLFISAAAIVFIVSVYRRVRPEQRAMRWGLPLALGGAIGNLVDRIRYGSVIDFIDFYVKSGGQERHWPTYNVADVAIVVGVALMAIDTLTTRHDPATATAPGSPSSAAGLAIGVPSTPPPGTGVPGQP